MKLPMQAVKTALNAHPSVFRLPFPERSLRVGLSLLDLNAVANSLADHSLDTIEEQACERTGPSVITTPRRNRTDA